MKPSELREALTKLGAFGDRFDFKYQAKKVTTYLVNEDVDEFDLKTSGKIYTYLVDFLDSYQENLGHMNRAADALKLGNLYNTIDNSGALAADQKAALRDRLKGINFLRPLLLARFGGKKPYENFKMQYSQYAMLKRLFEGDPRYALVADELIAEGSRNKVRKTQLQIIQHIKKGLAGRGQRVLDYFTHLENVARNSGIGYVALPKYYHCTGASSDGTRMGRGCFDAMLEKGFIQAQTPRGATGAFGAWVSSQPETTSYGQYVFALSFLLEMYYETAAKDKHAQLALDNTSGDIKFSTSQKTVTPAGKDKYQVNAMNAGLQSNISLKVVKDKPPSCLAFLALPTKKEVDEVREKLATNMEYAPVLQFPRSNGDTDCAVFLTDTALSIAKLYQEVQDVVIPREWNWNVNGTAPKAAVEVLRTAPRDQAS
jgi:hypothetical protein